MLAREFRLRSANSLQAPRFSPCQPENPMISIHHHRLHFAILLLLVFLTLTTNCFARAKKDVLQFGNGDRITCEIIKLEKGYLYVKLEYGDGTVALDWSKIIRVESPQQFVVADVSGNRYTGSLKSVVEGKTPEEMSELRVEVTGAVSSQVVADNAVVEIHQTESSFWQNLHGGMDAGLNYSKQQSRTQYNFDTNAGFERTKWLASANYQSSFSGGGNLSDLRNDLQLNVTRQLLSPRNFYVGLASFLQSNEQQLDLRTTLGGGVGHMFSYTNNTFIAAFGGVVYNRERYSSEATVDRTGDSAEAVLGSQVNFFRFKTTNILADARLYPSLTDPGRVRFDLNTSLKIKVAKDLYWRFGYYLNFDSRPPQNLPKSDYGSTSSLGWTF
jgi:putative salt-induced outer membrane protein YdiY